MLGFRFLRLGDEFSTDICPLVFFYSSHLAPRVGKKIYSSGQCPVVDSKRNCTAAGVLPFSNSTETEACYL